MRNDNPWKLQSSKIVYQNRWIRIREDKGTMPSGKPGMYAYMESNDSVVVVALNDKNEAHLIHKFSYPSRSWDWEIPQGGGDKENLRRAAGRELWEETGVTAKKWIKLGKFRVCNGLMSEWCTVYLARDITVGAPADTDEPIDGTKWAPMSEVDAMIKRGEINDSQSLVAIHLAQKWLKKQGE